MAKDMSPYALANEIVSRWLRQPRTPPIDDGQRETLLGEIADLVRYERAACMRIANKAARHSGEMNSDVGYRIAARNIRNDILARNKKPKEAR